MKKFGLIGYRISYSLSPKIHGIIYRELGINAGYELIDIAPDAIGERISELNKLDGFNVTQPHKTAITEFLTQNFSPVGAVNTVKVSGGKMYGYNTDVYGFARDIEKNFGSVDGMTALVMGAGGMAKAAAYVLKAAGARVCIKNRTEQKAVLLCRDVGAELYSESVKPDIAVNCSSAELFGGGTDLGGIDLSRLTCAYDTIYKRTDFIALAEKAGAKAVNGINMLIYQAVKAADIFLNAGLGDGETERLKDIIRSEL